jgi:hypothetical protein
MSNFNRYELEEVRNIIQSYYMPSPAVAGKRTPAEAFEAARIEAIAAFERTIALLKQAEIRDVFRTVDH